MKTTSLLACLMLVVLGFTTHDARPLPATDSPLKANCAEECTPPDAIAIGGWYLIMENCTDSEFLYCCCGDGNSYVCSYPLVFFTCRYGGPFECTSDLGNCEENPSNCETCCPNGRC